MAVQSAIKLLRLIEDGTFDPAHSIRLAQEAISTHNGSIGAIVHLDDTPKPGRSGPLRGIAVGIKDIIDTAAMPTEMGSPIYTGWRPKADACIVMALKRAGATIIGKTATSPFAYADPSGTRNPHNLSHTPGGSSSGSAAAVAAGMLPLSVGTQTGGSIIRPASFCGVVAIKPSFQLVPTVGVKCLSWTLDTVGFFGSTVADVAYALSAVTRQSCFRVDNEIAPTPRVGVVTLDFAGAPEPGSVAALERGIRLIERRGASAKPIALPITFRDCWAAHPLIEGHEARQSLAWEYENHRSWLPPQLRQALDEASMISVEMYHNALRSARRAWSALSEVFTEVDVLLTFSAPGPAMKGLSSTGTAQFNRLWTLLGVPCINIPALIDDNGLPIGVQVIGPYKGDRIALLASSYIEAALQQK